MFGLRLAFDHLVEAGRDALMARVARPWFDAYAGLLRRGEPQADFEAGGGTFVDRFVGQSVDSSVSAGSGRDSGPLREYLPCWTM